MEIIAGDGEGCHGFGADLDTFFVGARVERSLDLEAGLCRRGADRLDDGEVIHQWAGTPVLRDVAEQAMLDFIPL